MKKYILTAFIVVSSLGLHAHAEDLSHSHLQAASQTQPATQTQAGGLSPDQLQAFAEEQNTECRAEADRVASSEEEHQRVMLACVYGDLRIQLEQIDSEQPWQY